MRRLAILKWMFLLVGIAIVYGVYIRVQNRFTVTNASGQTVRSLRVQAGASVHHFENVDNLSRVSSSFQIVSDSGYEVSGILADGKTFHRGCGYLSNGMWGERARFVIDRQGNVLSDWD